MKKLSTLLLLLLLATTKLLAQNALTYQIIVHDDVGKLMRNSQAGFQVSCVEDSLIGTVTYSENHAATTNSDGIATLTIGNGTWASGDYASMDWKNHTYFLKTEIDPLGGHNYTQTRTQLIWRAPVANYSVESTTAIQTDYNDILNKPVLFSGEYDSLINKPVLFSGEYDSLTNKPILFDWYYSSLHNTPSIRDSIYKILADSNYLHSYTESQILIINGYDLTISGGNTITLPQPAFTDYYSLSNLPDLNAIITQALADSAFLKTYTEQQTLSISNDTLLLSDGGYVLLPISGVLANGIVLTYDTTQNISGTKQFTDTIIVPTRIGKQWDLTGDSNQIVNYEAMLIVIDSLERAVSQLKAAIYAPIVFTLSIDTTTFPLMNVTGEIVTTGATEMTERGFCFGLSPQPTIDGPHNADTTTGMGIFVYHIGDLIADTTYYIRAYATNSEGTNYGAELIIKSPCTPKVSTEPMGICLANLAYASGKIIDNGGLPIKERGVCWATTQWPTYADNHAVSTTPISSNNFIVGIGGLNSMTQYYLRAYAINDVDTAYGEEITFTTSLAQDGAPCLGNEAVYDYDGNEYSTVQIGSQCWMKENLRSTTYNGTYINTSSSTSTNTMYRNYPSGSSGYVQTYGGLYNWYATTEGDTSSSVPSGIQGICPTGWHVPSSGEFDILQAHINQFYSYTDTNNMAYWDSGDCQDCYPYTDENGQTQYYRYDELNWDYEEYCDYDCGYMYVGPGQGYIAIVPQLIKNNIRALAASGVWYASTAQPYYLGNETTHQNNASGFSAMPAGYYYQYGSSNFNSGTHYWITDPYNSTTTSYYRGFSYYTYNSMTKSTMNKGYYLSVRCLKD
ncbi:MAG: fibrobacter succinogenes major paralogous domain-containing protein [Bacteroidales bacterium]|nr:fibrobacter succinogenes major paralogous domain-containing protein [Bacteroidales bacterium]